jgi:hypothetical protein
LLVDVFSESGVFVCGRPGELGGEVMRDSPGRVEAHAEGLRALGADAPRTVARRFNRIAWPAFGVLVFTGIWHVFAVSPDWSTAYGRTVMVKVLVVTVSGLAAFLHWLARSTAALAVFGAVSGLTALGALFLGVLLR